MGQPRCSWVLAGVLLLILGAADGYYVPGAYPQEFKPGDVLQASVSSLTSFETEMPYDYYSLPFCRPMEGVKRIASSANPGTILEGMRMENSPYIFTTKVKQTGLLACKPKGFRDALTKKEVTELKHKIDNHYRVNMILDNLPVTVYDLLDEDQEFVRPGYELGYKKNDKYYIYNHLVFNILVYMTHGEYTAAKAKYNEALALETMDSKRRSLRLLKAVPQEGAGAPGRALLKEEAPVAGPVASSGEEDGEEDDSSKPAFYMIVGFEVSPCSIKREPGKPVEDVTCGTDEDDNTSHITPQEIVEGAKIVYTYDVWWQDSKIKWASRWDAYLRMPGGKVHWFSIVNSVLVVLVMASIVAMILVRTVRRDLQKYEQLVVEQSSLDMKDEAGWKLVAGDVFRAPPNSKGLAVQIGTGVQVMLTTTVTLGLATLGFLSPASRGALLTTTIVLFVWLSFLAGFVAVYMWGVMERTYQGWYTAAARVSVFFPGIIMAIFTVLNLVIHHTGTTGAVPVGMYFSIVAVWFLISIPLTFAGGFMAVRLPIRDHPVKTNQIPRHIPPPPVAANPYMLFFAAGCLPFGTLFIELYFAMTSLWLGYFYYLFGFVFLIGLLTTIINAEISVLCSYVQLCAEDYTWWWKSFHRGGSVAVYVTLYALGFLFSSLNTLAGPIPVLIYLSYMTILILGLYFVMGTVGFLASWCFIHYIFKAVKAD